MVFVENYLCFKLLTAALIVGWTGLLEAIVSSMGSIIILNDADVILNETISSGTKINEDIRTQFIYIVSIIFGAQVLSIFTSGFLIIGTIKRNHLLVLPWVIKNGIILVILSVLVFVPTNQTPSVSNSQTPSVPAREIDNFIFVRFIFIVFYWYTWIAMYSWYDKLRCEARKASENDTELQIIQPAEPAEPAEPQAPN